jgi:F-type H+-transporting ATPase subunit a
MNQEIIDQSSQDNQEVSHTSELGMTGGDNQHGESQDEHEHTLYAEPVFYINHFPVTNSLLTSWLAVFLIVILAAVVRLKLKKVPGAFQSIAEKIVEGALEMMDLVTGERRKSEKVFPVVFSVFIFILINNWLGLLPGVGSITLNGSPLFRGGTADLNTTLALALFSVVAANVFGVIVVGAWSYFNKFINLKALAEIPRKIFKEPTVVLVNPINFFVGLIEIVSEIAKVASLSFRLFGNIFAGEVLMASIAALASFLVPLPFMFLELIVGIVQALIFAVLTLVYFTIASMEHEH